MSNSHSAAIRQPAYEDFQEYLRLKHEREVAGLREMMAAASAGELEMTVYTSRSEAYADLGLGGTGS